MVQFIKYSKVWLGIAGGVVLVSVILLAIFGLKPGIDFTGGSLMELSFSRERPDAREMEGLFSEMELNTVIQNTDDRNLIIRTSFLSEDEHQEVFSQVVSKYQTEENLVHEERFETIGAAISQQLRSRASWAAIFVVLGIVFYVAYAFRKVTKPVASWKYGALAIVALIHDVLVVMAVFAILGRLYGVEVDIAFVVALLTVLGYSVNDSIVVYDRTRENLIKKSSDESFGETVNKGLNQTLMRSLNTSITTLLPLLALFFFGGSTIHYFVLALIIGIISGAYSSIFIASPLLVKVEEWQRR